MLCRIIYNYSTFEKGCFLLNISVKDSPYNSSFLTLPCSASTRDSGSELPYLAHIEAKMDNLVTRSSVAPAERPPSRSIERPSSRNSDRSTGSSRLGKIPKHICKFKLSSYTLRSECPQKKKNQSYFLLLQAATTPAWRWPPPHPVSI